MGVMPFLVKNCWTLSAVWAGALVNHSSWGGQTHWESFPKKFTEAEHSLSQQRQLVYWYRWVPRTLISLGKPELQEVCPPENNSRVFWVPHYNVLPRTTATKAIQRHTWKKTYINQNEILKKYRKKKWEMWNWEYKRKTKNKMADLSPKINDYTKCKWYKDTNGQKVGKVYWKHDPTIYCL